MPPESLLSGITSIWIQRVTNLGPMALETAVEFVQHRIIQHFWSLVVFFSQSNTYSLFVFRAKLPPLALEAGVKLEIAKLLGCNYKQEKLPWEIRSYGHLQHFKLFQLLSLALEFQ